MRLQRGEDGTSPARALSVGLAHGDAEIEAAQRLRHQVFSRELGVSLGDAGVDRDRFDDYCEHLIVRDHVVGEVVGTYRILTPARALAAGGYYAETEFDISRLFHLRGSMAELGRSCVHERYRSGAVVAMLWRALVRLLIEREYRYVIGCASVGLADGGVAATAAWRMVNDGFIGPAEYRVFPRLPLSIGGECDVAGAILPPLVKGYLNAGAFVCGQPAWDPEFNCADLFMMLPVDRLNARLSRRLLG
jgi:putative hemolysin